MGGGDKVAHSGGPNLEKSRASSRSATIPLPLESAPVL